MLNEPVHPGTTDDFIKLVKSDSRVVNARVELELSSIGHRQQMEESRARLARIGVALRFITLRAVGTLFTAAGAVECVNPGMLPVEGKDGAYLLGGGIALLSGGAVDWLIKKITEPTEDR